MILIHFHLALALSDAASVNVTISSQHIQNGSLLTLAAAYDPSIGTFTFSDLQCEYSDPAGGAPTRLTVHNIFLRQIVKEPALSAYNKARINITSAGNPMVLVISPITFEDEKRLFYCNLRFYGPDGNFMPPTQSGQYMLENVYSKFSSVII